MLEPILLKTLPARRWILGLVRTGALSLLAACGAPDGSMELQESTITRDTFLAIAEGLREQYEPEVEAAGAHLRMRAVWEEERFGAASAKSRGSWLLMIYGGTARTTGATEDALALIICHEWGHLVGGPPFMREDLAAEGQADWFATSSCLPRFWGHADRPTASLDPSVDGSAAAPSDPNEERDPALDLCRDNIECLRLIRASDVVMRMSTTRHGQPTPRLDTRDTTVVSETVTGYPSPQCRLDTMVAGALGQARPACWFRPESAD